MVIVSVKGKVDAVSSARFEEELLNIIQDTDRILVIDFAELNYISSAGLRVLLMLTDQASRCQVRYSLCSLVKPVRDLFRISGFDRIIPIYETREEALAEPVATG